MGKIVSIISLIVLVVLMFYSGQNYSDYYVNVQDFVKDPVKYDGWLAEDVGYVEDLENDRFILYSGNTRVLVKYKDIDVEEGSFVTILSTYHKEGYIELHKIHIYGNYLYKYLISAIAGLFVVFYLFKDFKLTRRGFVKNA